MFPNASYIHTIIGSDIPATADLLEKGALVAIPTETVYGLAANALDTQAVLKIFQTKNRPQFNPLIVHTFSIDEVSKYVRTFSEEAVRLAEAFWPGPLTLLLPKAAIIPDLVTSGSNLVAIRIPAHPLTLELLSGLSFPLVAPSANPSGYVSPTTAQHVLDGLKGNISYILDGGPCKIGLESTIIGWDSEGKAMLYRPGGLDPERIEKILGYNLQLRISKTEQPLSPGQLKSHYAPHTPLYFNVQDSTEQKNVEGIYLIRFQELHPAFPAVQQRILAKTGSLEEAAQNLFSVLRELDQLKPNCIYAEKLPDIGLGIAINDRLERAQQKWK